jgi:hypothetical protein
MGGVYPYMGPSTPPRVFGVPKTDHSLLFLVINIRKTMAELRAMAGKVLMYTYILELLKLVVSNDFHKFKLCVKSAIS